MPVIGNRQSSAQMGRGYSKDPISAYAAAFKDVAQNILNESGVDVFMEPNKVAMLSNTNETMKNFFMENSADRSSMTAEEYEDHMMMMEEQYLNDRDAVLEYSAVGAFNPVIGMTFPLHKNILMNNIFDKGAITKMVAKEPKFTLTMETRTLVDPNGNEIDMFKDQNKMFAAIESTAAVKEVVLTLPETEATDVLAEAYSADRNTDNLSIESHISAVLLDSYVAVGEKYWDADAQAEVVAEEAGVKPVWFEVAPKRFVPAYGEYDRQLMEGVEIATKTSETETAVVKAVLSGYMKKNMFTIMATSDKVKAVKLKVRLDTSSAMIKTCSVKWSTKTDIVEIPSAIPINTPVSPEEVKDIGALYQVNQLTKIMSMFKTVLGNYKDDKIKAELDNSFRTMPAENKLARTFDFAPRQGYALDHVEWRQKTFMDALDSYVTRLLQVLNDPNMTVTVIGQPDLIRKITPTEYTYQTPSSIGPVELDFVKTVTTSDKRVYQFISSDKLRGNDNLIIILNPRNTDRIIYRIYDYQMYVSNEIRNTTNYALPAIHAFERFKFVEYQPVQGRVKILNPTGLRNDELFANEDPIGVSVMNDIATYGLPTA